MKVCSNSITDGQLEFWYTYKKDFDIELLTIIYYSALSLDQAKENTKNGKMENFSDYDIIIKEEAVKNKTQEYLRHSLRTRLLHNLILIVLDLIRHQP